MSGAANPNKPPYRVPSVSEIAELPWNGFSVASTFSGCGGSSLGYRLAGFRVLWANEFVDAARASYEANKSPATIDHWAGRTGICGCGHPQMPQCHLVRYQPVLVVLQ